MVEIIITRGGILIGGCECLDRVEAVQRMRDAFTQYAQEGHTIRRASFRSWIVTTPEAEYRHRLEHYR